MPRNFLYALLAAGVAVMPAACNCGGSANVTTPDAGGGKDGGGDGGGGGGFDSGDPGDGGCGSVVLQGNLVPGNVVVVFDQSDSMSQAFGDAGPKWKAARDALITAVTPIQAELNLGAIFQPTAPPDAGVCIVAPIAQSPPQIPMQAGASFLTAFSSHFAPPWTLIYSTPLGLALDQANAALQTPPPGKTAVLVMTDGQPTCGENLTTILPSVRAMAARGIKTYVVGLPGASGSTVLMGIADAGGTGTYLLPNDAAQLQVELSQIATDSLDQCVFQLVPPPPDVHQVHLVVTSAASGQTYQIAEGAPDGWSLDSTGSTATLLGATCATAEDGGYSALQFEYGCVTVPFQ